MAVNVEWTGAYPNLCSGEWVLKVNGKDYSNRIPFQGTPAMTYGKYALTYLDGYEEETEFYKDGMSCERWIKENSEWLDTITIDKDLQVDIFKAFQENDWRPESCGGCI